MFYFFTPWRNQETLDFLTSSVSREIKWISYIYVQLLKSVFLGIICNNIATKYVL